LKIPKWMLRQTIQVEPYSGSGAYGPIYGNTFSSSARVQHGRMRTMDDDGNEITSDTQVFMRPGVNIPVGSKVYYESNTYTVNDVKDHQGLSVKSHKELVLL